MTPLEDRVRAAVADLLASPRREFSASHVIERVRRSEPGARAATVRRVLDRMEEAGELQRRRTAYGEPDRQRHYVNPDAAGGAR